MCSEAVLLRCSPKRCSVNIKQTQRGTTIQKSTISREMLCNFIEITPIHGCTTQKIAAHPQITLSQENTSEGLLLYVKWILKDLIYKKLLFTIVKRNLSTYNNNNNNNKCPVTGPRSFRKVLRFFHWALLYWQ